MADWHKRSLRKDVYSLTAAEKKFLLKYTCDVQGCGADFEFEIARGVLEQKSKRKKEYTGRCKTCGKAIKLSQDKYFVWRGLLTGNKTAVTDTTFDQLFE